MSLSAYQDLQNVLLRIYARSDLIAKGSSLTWPEEDMNFVRIVNAIREVALANASNFQVFNPSVQYSNTTPATYKSYGGKVYKYINSAPSTGITPGTNNLYWEEVPQGEFAHQQNTDSAVAFGTVNYTTALEIRTAADNSKKYYMGVSAPGASQNKAAGYSEGSFGRSDDGTYRSLYWCEKIEVVPGVSDIATWQLIWGPGA